MYVVVVRKLCMQFECPDVFFKRGEHSWQSTFPNSVTYSYYRDILIVFPNIHIRKTTNAATVNLFEWQGMRDMFRHSWTLKIQEICIQGLFCGDSLSFFKKIFVKLTKEENFFVFTQVFITQCGNYGNLLSRFFGKNFVKAKHLLNKLLKSWFDSLMIYLVNAMLSRNFCQKKRESKFP